MSVREYYDTYWSPQGTYPGGAVSKMLWRALETHLDGDSDCLDFGCGEGVPLGTEIASRAGTYVGLDVSAIAVERARHRGLDAREIQSEREIPLPDSSIDVAFSIEVFEHLLDPAAAASELARVLRPGGALIATTPNVGYWRHRIDLGVFGRWNPRGDALSATRPWRDPHVRFFTRRSLGGMLAESGFEPVEVGGHGGAFLPEVPGLRRLARGHGSPPYRALERIAPTLFGGRLLAVARKPATATGTIAEPQAGP